MECNQLEAALPQKSSFAFNPSFDSALFVLQKTRVGEDHVKLKNPFLGCEEAADIVRLYG